MLEQKDIIHKHIQIETYIECEVEWNMLHFVIVLHNNTIQIINFWKEIIR